MASDLGRGDRGRCSPDDALEVAGGAGEAGIVALEIASQGEQLQPPGLGGEMGGDPVLAQALFDLLDRASGVRDPEGYVAAGRFDLDLGDRQRRRRSPGGEAGQGGEDLQPGLGQQATPPGVVVGQGQDADPAQGLGGGQGRLRLGGDADSGSDAEAQAGQFYRAGPVGAAPAGDVEGPLARQAIRHQLAPDLDDQAGASRGVGQVQQAAHDLGLARRAQGELIAVASRRLGLGDLAGQTRTLVDQAQQLGVDLVDPCTHGRQRWRRLVQSVPQMTAGP
jgi:hypothetical protein